VLHVTNGDSAAERLRAAGIDGDVLPWRDALHEGPVPAGLDEAGLRAERARFVAARGWASERDALADMAARDARLAGALASGEVIVLWFESDLYDVLQLAQIAHRLPPAPVPLVLVGVDEFRGVAELSADELRAQQPTPADVGGFRALWDAFTAPDPRRLHDLDAPPVVRDAAHRHLQQFPWRGDGLNRSERALLQALADGARTREEAFLAAQRQEERPFLGDAVAFEYLAALPVGDEARAILAGEREWTGRPERWLGGVHLPAGEPRWRYDPATGGVG
jgi:Domain of unknown function (DUF1835)